tara:strand:- start:279 stop:503 length:225 start_codon:yes stop_codon:yes gene_type:complete
MHINELDAETRKRMEELNPELGEILKEQKKANKPNRFTAEDEKRYAIQCLNVLVKLDSRERARVLKRALKQNEV